MAEFIDIVIIGAGISGINTAYRVQTQLPQYSYRILEARSRVGGTWDLFRYPGIRSDSDLFTFGFAWNPWHQHNAIADGASIRQYIADSAKLFGIDKHIDFACCVLSASWSSKSRTWKIVAKENDRSRQYVAKFIVFGTGYYDYDTPLQTVIPGLSNFTGQLVHPQFWPEDLDYQDRKVVIIGSGATAITLVPQLAQTAKRVTMLQRSPSYILAVPNKTSSRREIPRLMPEALYRKLQRLWWILRSQLFVGFCQTFPQSARNLIQKSVVSQLPATIPYQPHFEPRYLPWEQRLCACPNGDFFAALRSGKAAIETGVIETVLSDRLCLTSGDHVEADIIVTATGLKLRLAGGVDIIVDEQIVDVSDKFAWRGAMIQDIPNTFFMLGYTGASWTLGADVSAQLMCRLLNRMGKEGHMAVIPMPESPKSLRSTPFMSLKSTYISIGSASLPKAATTGPWIRRKGYFYDLFLAKYCSLRQGLKFLSAADCPS